MTCTNGIQLKLAVFVRVIESQTRLGFYESHHRSTSFSPLPLKRTKNDKLQRIHQDCRSLKLNDVNPPAGFNIKWTYGLDTKVGASSEMLLYSTLEGKNHSCFAKQHLELLCQASAIYLHVLAQLEPGVWAEKLQEQICSIIKSPDSGFGESTTNLGNFTIKS